MDRVQHFRTIELFQKIKINAAIIFLWTCGIIFSYMIFLNVYTGEALGKTVDYINTLNILCMLMFLFSTCVFYFLFNHTYEKNQISKNMRASNYISHGLELLKEHFVLIDVEKDSYEFLYTHLDNEYVMKSGPYIEFISYLMDTVEKKSDKEMFTELFSIQALVKQLKRNNMNISIPIELNQQGMKRWDLLSFIVIEKKGKNISKILLSRRDITEHQTKEVEQQKLLTEALAQAENANKSKTTFLFNMSHDIRTPMNAIIGFTSMAKKHLDDPKRASEYLNKVDMSSQHMLHIVNDILDMARIDSGKVELESAPINIYKECYTTDALFRSSMEEKQIDFSVKINIVDDVVLGDAMRIKQIVVNLVSNAMKYTKPGGSVILDYFQAERDVF